MFFTLNQPLSPSPEWNSCYWKNTGWSAQQWSNSNPCCCFTQVQVLAPHWKNSRVPVDSTCEKSKYKINIWSALADMKRRIYRHTTMSWLQLCQLSALSRNDLSQNIICLIYLCGLLQFPWPFFSAPSPPPLLSVHPHLCPWFFLAASIALFRNYLYSVADR